MLAQLSCLVYNALRGKGRALKPDDFMPKYDRRRAPKRQSVTHMKSVLKSIANAAAAGKAQHASGHSSR